MKKIIAFALAAIMTAGMAGCSFSGSSSKKESSLLISTPKVSVPEAPSFDTKKALSSNGLTIWLPSDFSEKNEQIPSGSELCVMFANSNNSIAVVGLKEKKSLFANTVVTSVDDYLELQHENCKGTNCSSIKERDGIKYFDYDYKINSSLTAKYFSFADESTNDYWLIQCYCEKDEYNENLDDFCTWARTVMVS